MGTGAASFAGGGAAHSSGLNSIFDNPGALSISDEMQIEAGLMGLSGGISPYFLYGSHATEKSSYAFGYFYDARPGDPAAPARARQGMIAGASWEALPWAVIGGAVRSVGTGAGVGLDGFGIDEDAGLLLRPGSAFWLGLAARNLQESGVGQEPEGFRTHRNYALSLGTGLEGLHLIGITLRDPDAYYEIRSAGPPLPGNLTHAFSLASAFTPGGKLGFRGTVVLPPSGTPGFGLGTFLNLPTGNGALACAYTFQAGGHKETGEADASHSLSLNFRLGGKLDPLPPTVEVHADKTLAAPEDPESPARIYFRLSASDKTYVPSRLGDDDAEEPKPSARWAGHKASLDAGRTLSEGRIKEWTLAIRAAGADGLAGPEVKTFRGRDLPPRMIQWEAVDEKGGRLPPGFYCFRLDASDAAGNRSVTAWQLLEIGPFAGLSGN